MTTETLYQKDRIPVQSVHRALPAALAIMFGAFLVLGIGFANSQTIHNAAHDGRHALSFPCH